MMISGQQYIAGHWCGQAEEGIQSFDPAKSRALVYSFAEASAEQLHQVTSAAEMAFEQYRQLPAQQRADFLQRIAAELKACADELIPVVMAETALSRSRVEAELQRSCFQLSFLAAEMVKLAPINDAALPERQPVAKAGLQLRQVPLGPVLVFAASNFPLAFSVAGGDSAAALAAGCSVIVKAHSAHPATSELVARAIARAAEFCAMPAGVFNLIQARNYQSAEQLLLDPKIKAVAFTGSQQVGLHFARLLQQRAEPVPFYAELGSLNPVFVLPGYLDQEPERLAEMLVHSVSQSQGQLCTKPGLVLLPQGPALQKFLQKLRELVSTQQAGPLLSAKIAAGYSKTAEQFRQMAGVELLAEGVGEELGCDRRLRVFLTDSPVVVSQPSLMEEIFGPATVLVVCQDVTQMQMLATLFAGQLTSSFFAQPDELKQHKALIRQMELKAGRLIANMMPTGVEVSAAMQHGGPFPAATDSRVSAVGGNSLQRFLRPVCYQNMPDLD
jgi:alpha-ketoglutaric semialdehyde dehydrogenase